MVLYYIEQLGNINNNTEQTMLKLITGMVIGSLVTYNVILPNPDYKSTFVGFNDWTMAKVSALLEDVKDSGAEKLEIN